MANYLPILVFVIIASSMWWACFFALGRVWITKGLPVVIRPKMPEEDMRMP